MDMHNALLAIALDKESKLQVLCAPLVCLFRAGYEAVLRIATPRALAECCDMRASTEQLLAPRVLPYLLGGFVEVGRFGVGAEDVAEEEVCYAALNKSARSSLCDDSKSSYSRYDANSYNDQVERLLRCAHDLFAGR